MTSSTNHISFEVLAELTDLRLAKNEQESLLEHLQACVDCSRRRQELDQLVELMRTDDSVDAPQQSRERALEIFQRAPRQTAAPTALRRLIMALSFDSFTTTAAFGFRSGAVETRQLIFSAEDFDLDLRIAPLGDGWSLSGQVLGASCLGGELQLHSETGAQSTQLNDLCEFNLGPVSSGGYRLLMSIGDVQLEIPQLELGQ